MHFLRRSIIRKIGGFAALCAILLLSLAPAVSQSVEHARLDSLLASVCASGTQASPESHASHAKHGVVDHLQACAYCDLATHAPTPPNSPNRAAAGRAPREAFAAGHFVEAPRRAPLNDAQPRAPPALA
ncbi:MFS transporter [Caballeronia hypogeia]|uniref:MFS transporter n=1 Tax=Caballeronia hypogeia TaxID=1777140 RepID=A0A158BBV5_9BURK|nr:DUF2946 domain-containing protein [Caballeronia hypogeia]SAK67564.1 MFS transporter [Caballeronia hypogeia]